MNRSFFETLVGFLVVAFAAFFLYYSYTKAEKTGITDSYHIIAKFDRVDGISIGSEVRVSGIRIGEVTGRSLDNKSYRAVLTLAIAKDVKLPTDTSAQIVSEGLLGPKFISLLPGVEEEMFKDGGEIQFTQSSINIENLIGKMMFSKDDDKNKKDATSNP